MAISITQSGCIPKIETITSCTSPGPSLFLPAPSLVPLQRCTTVSMNSAERPNRKNIKEGGNPKKSPGSCCLPLQEECSRLLFGVTSS